MPIVAVLASLVAVPTLAQEEIHLWPGGAPGSEGKSAPETILTNQDGTPRGIATVHRPSLTVYLPKTDIVTAAGLPRRSPERAKAGVIVMPGGGHRYLAIHHEGHDMAKWLAERGVAAFVLKYRLAREEGSTYSIEQHALADAHRAMRLVRSRARDWNVDPERIGIIGFSAGGQLAFLAGTRFDTGNAQASDPIERESSRPAFQALIYSGPLDLAAPLPADVPPAFLAVALDDKTPVRTATDLFQKLRDSGAVVELHVYSTGGHGFGMRKRPAPVSSWPERFYEWMMHTLPPATAKPTARDLADHRADLKIGPYGTGPTLRVAPTKID